MPIDYDKFKRGETDSSWEQIVFQVLGDGRAYSFSELKNEIGMISPKRNNFATDHEYQLAIITSMLDEMSFRETLNKMEKEGRIISKYISLASGKNETYYMRKDLIRE